MNMQMKTRLKRLEKEYFPEAKRKGIYWGEVVFCAAFGKTYEGREDSAPPILLREYKRLSIQFKVTR